MSSTPRQLWRVAGPARHCSCRLDPDLARAGDAGPVRRRHPRHRGGLCPRATSPVGSPVGCWRASPSCCWYRCWCSWPAAGPGQRGASDGRPRPGPLRPGLCRRDLRRRISRGRRCDVRRPERVGHGGRLRDQQHAALRPLLEPLLLGEHAGILARGPADRVHPSWVSGFGAGHRGPLFVSTPLAAGASTTWAPWSGWSGSSAWES